MTKHICGAFRRGGILIALLGWQALILVLCYAIILGLLYVLVPADIPAPNC